MADEEFERIFNAPALPESEDCLYLNVFTPSGNRSAPLPVLFWIHGGGYVLGSGRVAEYDGTHFAAHQNVVVVSINYRLNVFGFPGAAFLPIDQRNLGLMDQRRALSWVNEHIGAFGGDPSKITLMGESVGAWSSRQLLTNPPETPQFRAAILQSPMPGSSPDTEETWSILARALNCSDIDHSSLDCVRRVPWKDIRQALTENSLDFTPVYDNKTNSLSYDQPHGNGHWAAHIPVLVGTNANEGTIFESIIPSAEQQLNNIFGNNLTAKREVFAAYPPGLSDRELQAAIMTDYSFTCPTLERSITAATTGGAVQAEKTPSSGLVGSSPQAKGRVSPTILLHSQNSSQYFDELLTTRVIEEVNES
ncbi:hypothetical protein MY3957_009789 [Beauveria namnaoensis]